MVDRIERMQESSRSSVARSRKGRLLTVFVLILTITFAGSGCGQKGPLFLPGANDTASAAAGSASAAAR